MPSINSGSRTPTVIINMRGMLSNVSRKIKMQHYEEEEGEEDIMQYIDVVCGERVYAGLAVCIYNNRLYIADRIDENRDVYIGLCVIGAEVGNRARVVTQGVYYCDVSLPNGQIYLDRHGEFSITPPVTGTAISAGFVIDNHNIILEQQNKVVL